MLSPVRVTFITTFFIITNFFAAVLSENNNFSNFDYENIILELPKLGSLKGKLDQTAWSFQKLYGFHNIPFSKPPTGNLRFKAPEPHPGWNDIRDASQYGRRCPVWDILNRMEISQELDNNLEDCLTLNVFTKNLTGKQCVMFYIHGGALINGTAAENRPNFLLEKNIVLVTTQYRLGPLGFLSTRSKEIPGNMGLMDIILALKWVQKFINFFGGDAKEITIFGESAGATLVGALMISPQVPKGFFKRTILQSGNSLLNGVNTLNPIERANKTCKHLDCLKCENIDDINKCLMQTPTQKLLDACNDGLVPFGFVYNDYHKILTKPPKEAVKESKNCYQFMAGITKHEGTFLTAAGGNISNPRDFHNTMLDSWNEADEFGTLSITSEKLYFRDGDLDNLPVSRLAAEMVDVAGDFMFKNSLIKFLDLYYPKCQNENNYLYSFHYVGQYYWKPFCEQFIPLMAKKFEYSYPHVCSVPHASDLVYLFPTRPLNYDDTKMAMEMVNLWTSFACQGKPFSNCEPNRMETSRGPYFLIDRNIIIRRNIIEELRIATKEKTLCMGMRSRPECCYHPPE